MRVKGNYVPKQDVVFCSEQDSLESVLQLLNETGYRCIPVLDETKTKFVGNVYKVDILEYAAALSDTVRHVVRDTNAFVYEESSFFKVFFTIKRLPFLAVIGESGNFLGILTHSKVFALLEDAWGVNSGVYSVTIGTQDYNGAIQKLAKVLKKYTGIQSLLTLDNNALYVRRMVFTLGKEFDTSELQPLLKELEENGFRIVHIEEL
ncbi:cyclic di-AMP binding protein CbpA [Ectobacillus antri]|uniref:Cyclic di-AMP binding protein CbpA n=1 Tax=Ectobacillus antri TaxID=2486280 RepID=A0ABT6H344_9BACI|nr:cyclic di-AMP binding protein CbpA [Ectobacillus antri]MDG4656589.1 cyclic di-AMP binding protein CbpA [Ectobacillus antri]MDG5753639.1 cyclic di-AMP binding protein CbpA [Ectobacillus antri]